MIDTPTLLHKLHNLFRLDVDASRAYQQAIDHAERASVIQQLKSFQADHERHIADLAAAIQKLGGTSAERKLGLQGFLLEGFTAIRSQTGTVGALKAMEMNEILVNQRYKAIVDLDLPSEVRTLIDRNFQDETRHLAWLREALAHRTWEQAPPPGP